MDLAELLRSKNVKVQEMPQEGPRLREQWESGFASHLSEGEKNNIYIRDCDGYGGFLWHLFSYGRRECLEGDAADEAFQQAADNACYIFYQHSDKALIVETLAGVTADVFLNEADIYVVDKRFGWTYVKTHETGWCGPYFCSR